MKRVFMIFLFIIMIVSYENVIFASYNEEVFEEDLYHQVDGIFKERIRIWNNFLTGQYISTDKIEEDLKNFISYPLIEEEIEMYEKMVAEPTSFEMISKVYIKDIDVIQNKLNTVQLEATVLWDVLGYLDNYTEELNYWIELKRVNDRWMLSDYKIN
ncbi:hypothetical protein [Alkaliphilus oremlandii]|uniref:DUF4829 domain-containing protein n=1 Tax=Alkaliphilus oremlandii (strain OhILAs) TaxID=350688 RepID=A8MF70_ALKOO|nr:hypothetical protein [Alkaliphilus oremlandii]ABW18739.1 hypothetical protein Clos_1193 [Alkaliphilus oremlandii OhILAs]